MTAQDDAEHTPQRVVSSHTEVTEAAIFLVVTVADGDQAQSVVKALLPDLPGLIRGVGFRHPDGDLACVVGIGSDLWDRLLPGPRPAHLHPFRAVAGATHTAVSTPGDLLFHLRARRMDLCFELAGLLTRRLDGVATVVDEAHGFRYFDGRDLLGFVDGTENPTGRAARKSVYVGPEDPDFAGGSYVLVQKYLHDLTAWNGLSVEEQEAAIGRSKLEDTEQADAAKATNSHVVLNQVTDDDGDQQQILRQNMPFGSLGEREFGTYFIGYAADPGVTEQMLRNMFVGVPEGNHDRILDFSTAVTGSMYFVPTVEILEELAVPEPPPSSAPTPAAPESHGSLEIGNLKNH